MSCIVTVDNSGTAGAGAGTFNLYPACPDHPDAVPLLIVDEVATGIAKNVNALLWHVLSWVWKGPNVYQHPYNPIPGYDRTGTLIDHLKITGNPTVLPDGRVNVPFWRGTKRPAVYFLQWRCQCHPAAGWDSGVAAVELG